MCKRKQRQIEYKYNYKDKCKYKYKLGYYKWIVKTFEKLDPLRFNIEGYNCVPKMANTNATKYQMGNYEEIVNTSMPLSYQRIGLCAGECPAHWGLMLDI